MTLSIAIVEDDARYRGSLAHAVLSASDMTLSGAAADVDAGRRIIDIARPSVLLVDLYLPGGSGIDLIRHAVARAPRCDVMVISIFGDYQHVLASIEAGATGYLQKDARDGAVVDHIRTLHAGGSPISPVIARMLLGRFAPQRTEAPLEPDVMSAAPSAQERKVLQLVAIGHTHDEIAGMMGVTRHTVLTYVKRVYRKLQVHNKVHALRAAQRLGWLEA